MIKQNGFLNYFMSRYCYSQLGQDLFVLGELDFKRNGYFVEFGAMDGIDLSNTYLLEAKFDWDGILAEPAHVFHADLRANRKAAIETDCVWSATGETLLFNEVDHDGFHRELSTLDAFSSSDMHKEIRTVGTKYEVNTISLLDMLKKHNAPYEIDYLSIDTEGSEFEILNAFDFEQYNIKLITCEHNNTPSRKEVHSLLTAHGYERVLARYTRWDDWYVRR